MMASDFGPGLRFSQIYSDTADVGVVVVGRTGKEVVYYLAETKRDREGDVQYWQFLPISEHTRRIPECRGTSVVIFND